MIVTDGARLEKTVQSMLSDIDKRSGLLRITGCVGDMKIVVTNCNLSRGVSI